MPLGILLPRIRIQKLLHLRHARVRLGAKPQLDLHQRLEAGVEVGHAQVNELGQFGEELLIEGLVGGFGEVGFAFGAGEFGWVFVGFLDEFFDFGAGGVVVEEFVVALFDAWDCSVLVAWLTLSWGEGEVGNEGWIIGERVRGATGDLHSLISGK